MSKPNCPNATAKRYLTMIFVPPTGWYSCTNPSGVAQNFWDELNDAQCAIERAYQNNSSLANSGFIAYVIDTQENKIAAVASSPKKPILDWQLSADAPPSPERI